MLIKSINPYRAHAKNPMPAVLFFLSAPRSKVESVIGHPQRCPQVPEVQQDSVFFTPPPIAWVSPGPYQTDTRICGFNLLGASANTGWQGREFKGRDYAGETVGTCKRERTGNSIQVFLPWAMAKPC
jgi:hypothetical protein